jgi:hypothetical protein
MKLQRPIEQADSANLRGSWPALRRAAERARQLAAQTQTAVVVMRNGVMEHVYPQADQVSSTDADALHGKSP